MHHFHPAALLRPISELARKSARFIAGYPYELQLASSIILGLLLSTSFFYGPSPIYGADNYIYADLGYLISRGQVGAVVTQGILAQQYLLLFGIALFYDLFGVGSFQAAIFGVASFIATIIVTYMIGSELYDKRAGAASAFLYSFIPIAVINSSNVGDNGPMALVASLSVLMLVKGMKRQPEHRRAYMLSGFLSLIGVLVTSQAAVISVACAILLLLNLAWYRDKEALHGIKFYVEGLAWAAIMMLLIGLTDGNGPLYIFTINSSTYSSLNLPTNQFHSYIEWIFPLGVYGPLLQLARIAASGTLTAHAAAIVLSPFSSTLKMIIMAGPPADTYYLGVGLFGYIAALSALYLVIRKPKAAIVPLVWIAATVLYLGYGTVSLTHYIPIGIAYPRFMLIFAPALAILAGCAAARIMEGERPGILSATKRLVLLALAIMLLAASVAQIITMDMSEYRTVLPAAQIASFLESLPSNSIVYRGNIPLVEYLAYSRTILGFRLDNNGTCTFMEHGSYAVLPANATIELLCGLRPVFRPNVPAYLGQYNLLSSSSFNYTDYAVYYRPG